MRGAGGTDGGPGIFLIGLVMMVMGFYLLFNSINVTSGMVLIPFVFGVAIIFYNARNPIGWLLAIGALVALFAGVLVNTQFRFQRMSAFELITIFVLAFGGLGLFLRSLRTLPSRD